MPGETITLYLLTGDSQGLRIATIFPTWAGKTLAAPRSQLKELLAREEMAWAGIYILLGNDTQTNEHLAYIGVGKSIGKRLNNHKEEFWTRAVAFVGAGGTLHEGHIKYLEGRLIDEAKKIARFKIWNDQASGSPLPEHERAGMDVFYEKMRLVLPVLDCDILVSKSGGAGLRLKGKVKNLTASGQRTPKGFVVFQGSEAASNYRRSVSSWMREAKEKLIAEKKLVPARGAYRFTTDCEFPSPSAAAVCICGGHTNGLTFWKTDEGKTLKEVEASIWKQFH